MIEVRKIFPSDAALLFNWANDKEVRKNAINSAPIEWNDHINWFNNKIASDDTLIYIGSLNNEPIGQIRFDRVNKNYIVDYSIASDFRGRGLGALLVSSGIDTLFNTICKPLNIIAYVKPENIASGKIFEKLNFTNTGIVHQNGIALYCHKLAIK